MRNLLRKFILLLFVLIFFVSCSDDPRVAPLRMFIISISSDKGQVLYGENYNSRVIFLDIGNIASIELIQKEGKDYKNHVSLNASMQLYNVKYFKNVIPLSPTESTFNSDVSSFFGMSYRYSINKNNDIGLSTGISITAHSNEMFLNSPITLDWRYNFSKVFAVIRAGAVLTYNENSASLIPSMGAEIGCAFDEGDVSLEVSCGILSGYWMSETSSSKSYILTEFLPIKISIVRNF